MNTLQANLVCKLTVLVLVFSFGCHRSYYRRQADADATRLIQEKSLDPHWSLPNYTIQIDADSRMFDPFSVDHPPMPPDDPSAAEYMQTVDGKPAFPRWHANGDTPFVDNPQWLELLPVDEDGLLTMDMNRAVEMALKHSPTYQRQLETLYLSALDVSLQRFDLEAQFFSPLNSDLTTTGPERSTTGSSTDFGLDNGVGLQLRKAGITGSNLIVGFANSFLWEFSGTDTTVGFGSLSFDLIQPLLRGAGRDVILESLTDSERGLLYNVRKLERYRRSFAQRITAGINLSNTLARGNAAIDSVSGVSQNAGGILGLLQTQQNIRIQQANIASQRSLLEQFQELFTSERIDLLQLKQFRSNIYTSQKSLMRTKAGYQTSLDSFKIQIGLPPEIEIQVEDPILEQFELIDKKITGRQNEAEEIKQVSSELFVEISNLVSLADEEMAALREELIRNGVNPDQDLSWKDADIPWSENLSKLVKSVRNELSKVLPVYERIAVIDFPQTENDIKKLSSVIESRRNSLYKLQQQFNETKSGVPPAIEAEVLDTEILNTLPEERRLEFVGNGNEGEETAILGVVDKLKNEKAKVEELLRIWDLILANDGLLPDSELSSPGMKALMAADPLLKDAVETRAGTIKRFVSEPGPEVMTALTNLIIDNSLIQALARVDSLMLPIVDIDWRDALEIARENRRDWMNARGQLVDEWRNVEISADSLESQLDLTFGGDLQNDGNNPLKLRDSKGRLTVGIEFDAPITRLAERNNYRSALISYQQTKRTYYQYEDRVSGQLREILRNLDVAKVNFELSRIQVKNSVDSVQLSSYNLVKPPRPGASTRLGDTVARDLIRALNNLLSDQNDLIANWVNYEVLRRQLDLHMGTMQLDENGIWIDPGEITKEGIQATISGGEANEDFNSMPLLEERSPQDEPMDPDLGIYERIPRGIPAVRDGRASRFGNASLQQMEDEVLQGVRESASLRRRAPVQTIAPIHLATSRLVSETESEQSSQRDSVITAQARPVIPRLDMGTLYNSDFDSDRKRNRVRQRNATDIPEQDSDATETVERDGAGLIQPAGLDLPQSTFRSPRLRGPSRIGPLPKKLIQKTTH